MDVEQEMNKYFTFFGFLEQLIVGSADSFPYVIKDGVLTIDTHLNNDWRMIMQSYDGGMELSLTDEANALRRVLELKVLIPQEIEEAILQDLAEERNDDESRVEEDV